MTVLVSIMVKKRIKIKKDSLKKRWFHDGLIYFNLN